ncbi:MAG: hypothetical protein ABH867_04900 [Patescibacteria group bacterium]|nr:hypothetical protein [Patescibacteria group bacterium]
MNKRRHFVLATALVSTGYYLVQIVPFDWKYRSILGLATFCFVYLLILFLRLARDFRKSLVATFLPVCFLVGLSLFHFFFFQGLIWQLFLTLIFAVGFYTLCLIENVFLVSAKFKLVPLYRAASTVGFLITLTSAFFLFDVLFSFRLSGWFNALAVFGISFLLLGHFFWTVDLSSPASGPNLPVVLFLSVIMAEMTLALSFWPVGFGRASLYLVGLLYVFGGLAQAYRRDRLFKKTILEFIWVGAGIFLALLLVTNWSGNF